jgi:hypothetical protein
VFFKIIEKVSDVETIAQGTRIRERRRLWKVYGRGRWKKLKGMATAQFADGSVCHAEVPVRSARNRRKGIQDQTYSGNSTKRNDAGFVACVKNKDYAASLELRKLYQVVPDGSAAKLGQIRVIDESGEDYLYPQEFFVPVQLPESAQKAVRRASNSAR